MNCFQLKKIIPSDVKYFLNVVQQLFAIIIICILRSKLLHPSGGHLLVCSQVTNHLCIKETRESAPIMVQTAHSFRATQRGQGMKRSKAAEAEEK